jgi:hypothetical protein
MAVTRLLPCGELAAYNCKHKVGKLSPGESACSLTAAFTSGKRESLSFNLAKLPTTGQQLGLRSRVPLLQELFLPNEHRDCQDAPRFHKCGGRLRGMGIIVLNMQ